MMMDAKGCIVASESVAHTCGDVYGNCYLLVYFWKDLVLRLGCFLVFVQGFVKGN